MVVEDNDVVTAIIALGGDEDDEIGANAEHCLLLAIMMVTMAMTRRVSMMARGDRASLPPENQTQTDPSCLKID